MLWRTSSIAAILILIGYTTYWMIGRDTPVQLHQLASHTSINIETVKNVQLTLSKEKTITLDGKEPIVQYSDSGEVVIIPKKEIPVKETTEKEPIEAIGINTLTVPLGKRSLLTLSDGSKMWINSGTTVAFPAIFGKNKREIYVNGEIYIEVVPDKTRPFYVNTKDMNIRVIGTTFNVTAYETEKQQAVILVEGSVQVHAGKNTKAKLEPDQRFSYQEGKGVVKKVDVQNYISWKNGFYQYSSERIETIIARLSRYYGIKITCEEEVKKYTCSGKLDLTDDITDVLHIITQTVPIKYEQIDKEYILKQK